MTQGLLAAFATEADWGRARARLLEAGIVRIETYTPAPAADLAADSPLPAWVAAAGILGALAGFGMQCYANGISYPLDIGGRPNFSWPSFVPIAFEIGALCAVLAGFFGFFLINHLPRLYDPIDACSGMRNAMRSDWVLAVRGADAPQLAEARRILAECDFRSLEEFAA